MKEKRDRGIMKKIATLIVNGRYIIFVLFVLAALCSVFTMGKVRVNSDIKSFLPKNTETRRGIDIMAGEFVTYGSATIMLDNIEYADAEKLSEEIAGVEHVYSAVIDNTKEHYNDGAALISVSFDAPAQEAETVAAMEEIKALLDESGCEAYIDSEVGENYSDTLAKEMIGVILISALVIVTVLLLTSRSYFEVAIFLIVFIIAGILNMGTNYWLGEISSITNSVAIILQLALAIDYSIIFSHRYQDELRIIGNEREALIEALSKAIVEITSSSLTTISGLAALTLMQFRLGYDLGTVLSKGIISSLITVFLFMPGLIALFPGILKKTAHKNLIPDIKPWGRFLTKSKYCFVILFFIILPLAVYFSSKTEYAFADASIDELIYSESRASMHKITDTFGASTAVAVLVPTGSYEKQAELMEELGELESIKSVTGLAGIDIGEGRLLTDEYGVDDIVGMIGVERESIVELFTAYRLEHEGLAALSKEVDDYQIPLLDLFEYLYDKVEQGVIELDADTTTMIYELQDELRIATDQLSGTTYDRIVLTTSLPAEGEESRALVEKINAAADEIYGDIDTDILVIGDITSARDLADSYTSDSLRINMLTICFVFIIILCTFKTVVGAMVLVFVIQGSIWINFSFPYLQNFSTSFVTNMIVSAIQMGATIDYAIVLMNRYLLNRRVREKRAAMEAAVSESFATVFTSGSILTVAGLLIAYRVSDVYVGHIGLAVGRGALISIILVLTVLPQLILLCDGLIERTRIFNSVGEIPRL